MPEEKNTKKNTEKNIKKQKCLKVVYVLFFSKLFFILNIRFGRTV